MSYYGAGDYYGAGGIGSWIGAVGSVLKRTAQAVVPFTPLAPVASVFEGLRIPGMGPGPMKKIPGAKGAPKEIGERKRRRMNYANGKALKRSIRRQKGFVKLAKGALKGSGYKIVPKGSGRSRRPQSIRESGAGSVIVN